MFFGSPSLKPSHSVFASIRSVGTIGKTVVGARYSSCSGAVESNRSPTKTELFKGNQGVFSDSYGYFFKFYGYV